MDGAENPILARLRQALAQPGEESSDFDLNPGVHPPKGRKLRQAGVLVPVQISAEARVILTKRSARLRHHPGQIAFPGGKVEDHDDGPVGAALRETHEEIGLSPDRVEVLGTLPAHETVTGFVVTPVIGVIRGTFEPVLEVGEVAEVFRVPLGHLADPANYRVEGRRWQGRRRHYFAVPWGPYYIWGATGRMLRALADRMAR